MKLLFAALSLLAVAFALRSDRIRYRSEMVDARNVETYRAGQTYKYQLDTQISSGMASVSDQHGITRLQSEVMLHFQSDRKVALKLQDVMVGSLNRELNEPERVQPMEMFKKTQIKEEESRLLELPCTFEYADGLIENIRFHNDDQPWSKNIKKTVMNMLQLNLKQKMGSNIELEKRPEWNEEYELKNNENEPKMFVMPEITLEGECQTVYTINKNSPRQYNSEYDTEVSRDESLKLFNVTKSIDFKQCRKIADIRYGPKVEKPCDNCTTPEELEERKLDRSTVLRHMIVGTSDKYAIRKVELVSHYVFKMLNVEEEKPMHAIVAGELTYLQNEESRKRETERDLREVSMSGKEETLLYNTEWDEKEKSFYMYGDEAFPQYNPFQKVQDKVGKVEKLMNKFISMWSDKNKGIESEASLVFHRIVEVLRMCSHEELQRIYSRFAGEERSQQLSETEQVKAEELLIDALANAGTYNTIKLLADKIMNQKIQNSRIVRALTQLKDLPAPSDKQVELLTKVCQNEVCSRFHGCRQTCWLATGAIMGELCNEELTVDDALEQKKGGLCQSDIKNKFIKSIMTQYNKAETRYHKILLLKSLGNAGVDTSVFELEKIIRDIREDPLVRMQAIDSLRRLRAVMPEKIQRVLMPIFQNVRERPEVRMACISQILSTIPEKPILDMIGLTLIREPSRQVKSYVYTAMKHLSSSPIHMEKELAQHLKALLKLAGVTEEDEEEILKGSRYIRIPIYSKAKKEGFFMDLESMVGPDNVLPKHLHAGLDSFFNGIFKKSNVEVSFTQEDLEKWYENIMNVFVDYYYGELSTKKSSSVRGYRTSGRDRDSSEVSQEFRSIVSSLSIKRRVDTDSNNSPYGMFSFRVGDVDYAILPFEEELMPEPLKKIINGERPSFRDFEKLLESRHFNLHGAINMIENSIKVPTSMGLPIRMLHVLPILASIDGQYKPRFGSEVNVDIQIHTKITGTHLKRVEVWSPIINTGVETTRTAVINLPVTSQLTIKKDSIPSFKWSVQVPEQKFQLFSFHSLPFTFVSELDWMQQRTPTVKRIDNKELVHRAQHIEQTIGQKNFDLPVIVSGEIHMPHRYSYEDIVNLIMTTENHIQMIFDPTTDSPREIVLMGEGKFFEADSERTQHREFKDFYSKSRFDNEMEQYYEEDSDDDSKLEKVLNDYEPRKMYQHTAKLTLKTVGGRRERSAQMEVRGSCDDKVRFCKANLNIRRTPLPSLSEQSEWTFNTQIQALFPEKVHDYEQYEERSEDKHHKFICTAESKWGTEQKQVIKLNINGEKIRNKFWTEKINEVDSHDRFDAPKLREQMKRKVAFLNKYDITCEYRELTPSTDRVLNWASSILKSWNFWNTQVELKDTKRDSRNGQLTATIVIDPLTHEHANVTVKTPTEIIRINSMALPMKIKPFKLVSPVQSSVESFTDIVRGYTTESRPECRVDSRKVRTFDDVSFKAPLTKCYSVLAKDCSNEEPRFAVMMKKINDQDKMLKMITRDDKIEIERDSEQDKLIVKVNGRTIKDIEQLREYNVDYSEDMVRINTKECSVRFDGKQAWVKISPFYKNSQCGLCGNYNDNTDDEYRTSNNELTSDLKSFHMSYSLSNDECRSDLEETHRREEYEPIMDSRENYEREEEYQTRRRNTDENDETRLIEKTEVIEHSHKICFSVKPVKACPEGSYPDKTKTQKVSFTCMDRTSSEARRLLREARRYSRPVELTTENASFVQQLTVPTTCVVY